MDIRNEDVVKLVLMVPEGHRHLRATFTLADGTELTLQEATVANLVRAYTLVKTHPLKTKAVLAGGEPSGVREGFARWQLVEVEDEDV